MLESDSLPGSAEPSPWETRLATYLEEAGDSWEWGYQYSALSHYLSHHSDRVGRDGLEATDIDRLLMTWQLARAFRPEYSNALLTRLRKGVLEGR